MVSAPYGLDLQNITKNLLEIMHILGYECALFTLAPPPHFQFNWFIRFIIVLIVGSG